MLKEYRDFKDIIGKTFVKIEKYDDAILFFTNNDGKEYYKMHHDQECCEDVYIKQIDGELEDITNSIILNAEEVSEGTTMVIV